jgi:S-adenosylmethionine synthetase
VELIVSELEAQPAALLPVEVVERKGLGHPDTICDALAESVSHTLSRYYVEHFGRILHHNVDKVLLCAGVARPAFGAGEILQPMDIYICGRATLAVSGVPIPVEELAEAACRDWLRRHLPALDPVRHVRLHMLVRPGSPELVALFLRRPAGEPPLANDTSIGVGYAPLSDLERVTLAVEHRLNSRSVKQSSPALGEDVKVLSIRRGERVDLTVACAIVGRHVRDLPEYLGAREHARDTARDAARRVADLEIAVDVNVADEPATQSVYLTVTGTSAEGGDDGQTGRGNRPNGLITPYRPMSLEATAGKNPVSHPGRLYQIAGSRIAAEVVHSIEEVAGAECYLASRIGRPITDPQIAEVRVRLVRPAVTDQIAARIRALVDAELERLATYWVAGPDPSDDYER